MEATAAVGLSQQELNEFYESFAKCAANWKETLEKYAPTIARMSGTQLTEFKTRFRGVLTADQVERLVLFGKGKISEHLAKEKIIPAAILRRMRGEALKLVNDPNAEIDILTAQGLVQKKKICELTPFDARIAFDSEGKERSKSSQRDEWNKMTKKIEKEVIKTAAPECPIYEFESVIRGENDTFVIYAKDNGVRICGIVVPHNTINQFTDLCAECK